MTSKKPLTQPRDTVLITRVTRMTRVLAASLLAISAYPTSAGGQIVSKSTSACPTAAEMSHQHLQGVWHAQLFDGAATHTPAATAILRLGPHPELAHSVRGTVEQEGITAAVSGDVDDGDLTLEESLNQTNISATWIGRVVDGSCGKEIRGTWNNVTPNPTLRTAEFVLRKQAAWQ